MDPERRKAIDAAEAAGYLPQLRNLVQNATVPLWWWRDSSQSDTSILHNGTLSVVDTGEACLGITAAHVYGKYLAHRREYDDIECQIGNVRIVLEDYLLASNDSLDLVTFDISPILLAGSGVSVHAARKWPPANLQGSEVVVLGGYPGLYRREGMEEADYAFVTFFARVAQSSDDHVAFQLNISDSHWPDGSGGVPEQPELGGMSGGPVFRYYANPVEYLEIAGFVYEASPKYELIFARHASCISGSGHFASDA